MNVKYWSATLLYLNLYINEIYRRFSSIQFYYTVPVHNRCHLKACHNVRFRTMVGGGSVMVILGGWTLPGKSNFIKTFFKPPYLIETKWYILDSYSILCVYTGLCVC